MPSTYYWLGTNPDIGSGNVNSILNWTLWGPSAANGSLPPSGLTLPAAGDNVIFARYNVNGVVYPRYAPSGTMQANNSFGQYFNDVIVNKDCPVSLGITSSYFSFRAKNLYLNNTVNSNPNYINLISMSGYTASSFNEATVVIQSGITCDYYLKGKASQLFSPPSTYLTTFGKYYLNDFTSTRMDLVNFAYGNDSFYFYNSTNIIDVVHNSTSTTYINSGYGTTGTYIAQAVSGPIVPRKTIEFVLEGISGPSGPTNTRSTIQKLNLSGYTYSYNNSVYITPYIEINHPVKITELVINGGEIMFNLPYGVTSAIGKGTFVCPASKITSNKVHYGTDDNFIIKNSANPNQATIPNIVLKGNHDIYVLPAPLT